MTYLKYSDILHDYKMIKICCKNVEYYSFEFLINNIIKSLQNVNFLCPKYSQLDIILDKNIKFNKTNKFIIGEEHYFNDTTNLIIFDIAGKVNIDKFTCNKIIYICTENDYGYKIPDNTIFDCIIYFYKKNITYFQDNTYNKYNFDNFLKYSCNILIDMIDFKIYCNVINDTQGWSRIR